MHINIYVLAEGQSPIELLRAGTPRCIIAGYKRKRCSPEIKIQIR
jgi:hypothetical protein